LGVRSWPEESWDGTIVRAGTKEGGSSWVRLTSALVRNAIREHARAARQSKNLDFLGEINILAQFLILILSCRVLSIAIHIAGPVRLSGLAQFGAETVQQVDRLQESLHAGVLAGASGTRAT